MTRQFDVELKVSGWTSEYATVQRFLDHYARKTKSESTRENILGILGQFLRFAGEPSPDLYVKRTKGRVEKEFQAFLDDMKRKDRSIRYINMVHAFLSSFFELNGFKNGKTLEVERYHQPSRYRKKEEYIPTNEEVWRIIESAGTPKCRALLACLYTSGLRNSTLRSLLYRDVRAELEDGKEIVKLPVYVGMKEIVPDACKNSIPYFSFISKETTRLLKIYIAEAERRYGRFQDDYPLFIGQRIKGGVLAHVRSGTIEWLVHEAARKAGIPQWKQIMAHSFRKAFQNMLKSEFSDRKGRMDGKDQEFLMGHILSGSQDFYYDSSKLEYLRSEYSRLAFENQPNDSKIGNLETEVRALKETIRMIGSDIDLDKLALFLRKERQQQREELLKEINEDRV